MSVKAETRLQERIQSLIKKRGGYVNKNWGSMISNKGIGDLTVCYKGVYLAIEVKEENGKPSLAQGIHCRKVWHSGGITMIAWSVTEVDKVLSHIDYCVDCCHYSMQELQNEMKAYMNKYNIDDGTRW